MRSSVILGVTLLLTIAATSIVQARTIKSEFTYGNLGSGTNACKSENIVVKAVKVQKPLVYASPQAINEAAIARSNSKSKYTSSSSSSCSSSSVGFLGKLIGGSYSSFKPVSGGSSSNSGCGCGKKSEPLEVRDLLFTDPNKQIVPSFEPIGDLCYPNHVQTNKLQVTTKVTPARPSKITYSPPISEQVCVNVLNGQIDQDGIKKLGLNSGTNTGFSRLFDKLSAFDSDSRGKYIFNNAGNTQLYGNLGGYSSSNSVGYSNSNNLGGYSSSNSVGYSNSNNLGGYSSSNSVGYSNSNNLGGYSSSNSVGYSTSGNFGSGYTAYAGTSIGSLGLNSKINNYGTYENKFGTLNNVNSNQALTGNYKSNCYDFGDDPELPQDYSYSHLPADPVSLSLAYKNFFPRITVYNNKNKFVPEDKLSFGHRTIPTETTSNKKKLDVPEEKLQVLDKPVVELKPLLPSTITVNIYDEQEETKLAELEAIERERLNQEVLTKQQQNVITYEDLGYVPINGQLPRPPSTNSIDSLDVEDSGCGPVGPPAPDYVPGSIVINREIINNENEVEDGIQTNVKKVYVNYNDENSYEEDDTEDSTSGIFDRFRYSAQKYNYPCGTSV
ncbi:uncharacterized protein [Anoplolepis gracilipes]|uniref:uncharacterized protein n=1 Tax=Anoplolepis gracilipes TaxID=354296 RepID=UPI003BA2308C